MLQFESRNCEISIAKSSVFTFPAPRPIPKTVESTQVTPSLRAYKVFERPKPILSCAWIPNSPFQCVRNSSITF